MRRESSFWWGRVDRRWSRGSALVVAVIALTTCYGAEPERLGVVESRPSGGIFVPIEGRYMVPYTAKIPGSDVEYEMVPIPGGTFLLGSSPDDPNHRADEGPAVRVRVAPMWVGKCEITQAQYREFEMLYHVFTYVDSKPDQQAENGVDIVTAPTPLYSPEDAHQYGDGPNYPAVSMTQYAAQQFTKWLSVTTKRQYRLPTEAEWEYACRGGSNGAYAWGDDPQAADEYAWHFENTTDGFLPCGQRKPNAFGLYDMHGNVGEWTVNAYTKKGYRWLSDRPQLDAVDVVKWPITDTSCVVRGGTWESDVEDLRCAARLESDVESWKDQDPDLPRSPWWFSSDPALSIGFRVFRSYDNLDSETIHKFWDHAPAEVLEDVQIKIQGGRGKIILLDERLLPAVAEVRKQMEKWATQREKRRQQIRSARPD